MNENNDSITRLDLWLQDKFKQLTVNKESYEENISLLLTLCWYNWKGINSKVFEDCDPQP